MKKFELNVLGFVLILAAIAPAARSMDGLFEYTASPRAVVESEITARPGGRSLYLACTKCHGERGDGSEVEKAPALRQQSAWYLRIQIKKIRDGIRAGKDTTQPILEMREAMKSVTRDDDLELLINYVGTLGDSSAPAEIGSEEAKRGARYFAVCANCHGRSGEGNESLAAPKLAGLQRWYIETQLKKFRSSMRGGNPSDTGGAQMLPFALMLPDDAAVSDVAAYIATLGK